MRSTTDLLVSEIREPTLDEINPGGTSAVGDELPSCAEFERF